MRMFVCMLFAGFWFLVSGFSLLFALCKNQNTATLVAVRKTTHARHDAEHVVVGRIDADLRRLVEADRVVGERQLERRVINARHVARAAGLVVLGVERERVDVDADRGDIRVVLERLDQVEVLALTLREPVVAVQLDLADHRGVLAGEALNRRDGIARLRRRAVKPVRVVERLLALVLVHRAVAGNERIALDDPDKLLARVVERHLDLVGRRRDRLIARELELLNEVLVGNLGEAAALLRVKVDVVNIERRRNEAVRVDAADDRRLVGPAEVAELVELKVYLDLVVLERNEREREARVAVEPELERDVQRVLRRAAAVLGARVRLAAVAVIVAAAIRADLPERVDELRDIANHLGVAGLLARRARELVPDVEPVTVVLVNALAADLNLNVADQVVADPVEPAELRARGVLHRELNAGERGLEIRAVNEITVAADCARHALAEVGNTVERLLNGLHGEVGVAAVELLEKGNLRVRRQVYVLGTIGDELH